MVAGTEGEKICCMFSKWSLFMQSRNYIVLQLIWFAVQLLAVAILFLVSASSTRSLQTILATNGKQKCIGTALNIFYRQQYCHRNIYRITCLANIAQPCSKHHAADNRKWPESSFPKTHKSVKHSLGRNKAEASRSRQTSKCDCLFKSALSRVISGVNRVSIDPSLLQTLPSCFQITGVSAARHNLPVICNHKRSAPPRSPPPILFPPVCPLAKTQPRLTSINSLVNFLRVFVSAFGC